MSSGAISIAAPDGGRIYDALDLDLSMHFSNLI
jgi:hypothetical protein